jgi:hypothetical protein
MKAKQRPFAATRPADDTPPAIAPSENSELLRQLKERAAELAVEGRFPALTGATGSLNSQPLTPLGIRARAADLPADPSIGPD